MANSEPRAPPRLRVAIIGGGLSGLCLANGLLNHPEGRFEVTVYERDTMTFSSERGGYQIRLGQDGIDGLKECLDSKTYTELAQAWGSELSRAPALVQARDLAVIQKLNDLKHYPKSRAVPRSILKDYLLRIPLARNAVCLSKTLAEVQSSPSSDGNSKIAAKFTDGTVAECDILIAADGVRSVVNRCMKINNVAPNGVRKLVQGRCPISREASARLPAVLRSNGSILFLNGDFVGFAAVYESHSSTNDSKDDSAFLFWSTQIAPADNERVENAEDKAEEVAKIMEEAGFDSNGIPLIIRLGRHNVKMNLLSSSSEPLVPWRKDEIPLGRIILIGDSIHAMTPGRGQGANQAMKDAGVLKTMLFDLVSQHHNKPPSDKEVWTLSQMFDKEMYQRAFPWVKASKDAFDIDTNRWPTYLLVRAACAGLQGWGVVTSLLEGLYLRKPSPGVAF